jgi:hypothetical protein
METFMSGAMMIEAGLLSVLLAVWMTWLGLRGLFLMMPAKSRAARPAGLDAGLLDGNRRRHAA